MTNRLGNSAAKATNKFFGETKEEVKKENAEKKDRIPDVEKKREVKQVFSFRADRNDVIKWRLYASVKNVKVDDLGAIAMNAYLETHPLNEVEQALFDMKIKDK